MYKLCYVCILRIKLEYNCLKYTKRTICTKNKQNKIFKLCIAI